MNTALPPKPQIGDVRTFLYTKISGITVTGVVTEIIVDTPERWKVKIQIQSIGGETRFICRYRVGQHIMFEHYNMVLPQEPPK